MTATEVAVQLAAVVVDDVVDVVVEVAVADVIFEVVVPGITVTELKNRIKDLCVFHQATPSLPPIRIFYSLQNELPLSADSG